MIEHVLDAARTLDPARIVVVVGHKGDQVRAALGDGVRFADQTERLGTGHAVMQAEIGAAGCDAVLVLYGDMPLLRAATLQALWQLFRSGKSPLAMLAARSRHGVVSDRVSRGFGRVIRDASGKVQSIIEEADCTPEQLALTELNPGVYCFDAQWLWSHLPCLPLHADKGDAGEYFITDLVALAVGEGHGILDLVITDPAEALGINTPEHLAEAEAVLRRRSSVWEQGSAMLAPTDFFDLDTYAHRSLFEDRRVVHVWDVLKLLREYLEHIIVPGIQGEVMPGAHVVGEHIFIGAGSVVEPGALIRGPAYIGRNSQVRHGAYVRERVLVGDNCVVGHATEIKDSIMLDHAHAAHFAYVGDSIVGSHTNLGAGTRLANLKLDNTTVKIRLPDGVCDSGMHKLGAIVGDRVQIGCNTVTNPGTLLAPDCRVYALSSPRGYYPPGTIIRPATHMESISVQRPASGE